MHYKMLNAKPEGVSKTVCSSYIFLVCLLHSNIRNLWEKGKEKQTKCSWQVVLDLHEPIYYRCRFGSQTHIHPRSDGAGFRQFLIKISSTIENLLELLLKAHKSFGLSDSGPILTLNMATSWGLFIGFDLG